MCGRAKLATEFSQIKIAFQIPPAYPTPNSYAPSWNVAPTDSLPIARYNEKTGSRTLDMMRWGLIPYWAKDIKIGFSTINARAEDIEMKPAFRDAFRRRRCLVPIDSFYEWKKLAPAEGVMAQRAKLGEKNKQPYAIGLADHSLMALAGLWENWKSPGDEWIRSFTIVTTTANSLCAPIHDRMPVVLPPSAWPVWLGEEPAEADALKSLLVSYSGLMTAWPVSARVGNVKNNDASLIEPVT